MLWEFEKSSLHLVFFRSVAGPRNRILKCFCPTYRAVVPSNDYEVKLDNMHVGGWVYKVTVEVSCDCFELALGEASDALILN